MEIDLSKLPLFRGVDSAQLESLLAQINYQRKAYPEGSLVVSQGSECDRLMVLTEGEVKTEMTGMGGKCLKIEDLQAPSVLASAFLFGHKTQFPVNVLASTTVRFLVIPRDQLLKLFQLNQIILQNFLNMISGRAQFISEKLRFHSFKSLKSKLAYYLIQEASGIRAFKMRHSQNELAELFGVARPSVGRALLQLQDEGVIDIRYKQVQILNFKMLNLACEEL
jgi:CRP/FNR family transcriptional regulator, dissimilatory nitrate respiration regulator